MKKTLIALAIFAATAVTPAWAAEGTLSVPGVVSMPIPDVAKVLKDEDAADLKMFKARAQAAKDLAPPPILEIVGLPNQTIEFKGVQAIRVHAPGSNQSVAAALFQREPSTLEKFGNFALRTVEVLANPLVTLKLGKENAITQRQQIEANVETHRITLGTVKDVAVEGINKPVFAQPMPTAHAPAPATGTEQVPTPAPSEPTTGTEAAQ